MKNLKSKIKAVIFDMDGTIINTEHIWKNATIQVLRQQGIYSFSAKENEILESMQGIGLTQSAILMKEKFNLQESIPALVRATKHHAQILLQNGVTFIEGFEIFHKKLRSYGIPSSVASNADQTSLQRLSNAMQLHKFFGTKIYSIDSVDGKAKPDPTIFLHAAKQLAVSPQNCIVFEDSIVGFKAAQAAGMKCIAIKNKNNTQFLHHAHDAIDTYHEAERALSTIL